MAPVPAHDGELHLSITPVTPAALPPREKIEAAARALLDSTPTWKQGKQYHHGLVQAWHRPKGAHDGAGWHARHSLHATTDGTFDDFWQGLSVDKAVKESQFIPELKDTRLLKDVGPGQQIWSLHYVFPPPMSPRVFTVLVTIFEDANPRTGWVVSMPVDVSGDKELAAKDFPGVRGRYVSIERVRQAEDKVDWLMATSSTPGGNLPSWIAEMSIDGQISHDVPKYVEWLKYNKAKPTATTSAEPPAPSATS